MQSQAKEKNNTHTHTHFFQIVELQIVRSFTTNVVTTKNRTATSATKTKQNAYLRDLHVRIHVIVLNSERQIV